NEAEKELRQARAFFSGLLADDPYNRHYRHEAAVAANDLAILLQVNKKLAEAEAHFDEELKLLTAREASTDDPTRPALLADRHLPGGQSTAARPSPCPTGSTRKPPPNPRTRTTWRRRTTAWRRPCSSPTPRALPPHSTAQPPCCNR